MDNNMVISDKVVLVTGAGHGIGAAIAERLARHGAKVGITYRDDKSGAMSLVKNCQSAGLSMKAYHVSELMDESETKKLFQKVIKDFGGLDVFIANAGNVGKSVKINDNLNDLDIVAWQRNLNENLMVTVITVKYAIKALKQSGGGKIVMIGSTHGLAEGSMRITAYSAAKAATHNFARTLAKALAPDIAVNVVAPGRCWSVGYDKLSNEEVAAKFAPNKHGRPIESSEIAQAVNMVLENDSIIGQVINVEAGFTLLNS
jgi:NAD(P)-dependent dehydrogenase (short-subunit alcohol dehydrogenase family)